MEDKGEWAQVRRKWKRFYKCKTVGDQCKLTVFVYLLEWTHEHVIYRLVVGIVRIYVGIYSNFNFDDARCHTDME